MLMSMMFMTTDRKMTFESMGKTLCSRASFRLLPSREDTSNVF